MRARLFLSGLVALAVLALSMSTLVPAAWAQEKYPSRPIDFIVPWGTGGGADAMARQIGALSQPLLGVALPISNVPGASGNTGLAQMLTGKPDGYTIGVYIPDTLMTIPMGLARHKVEDLEWIARTQVADSFLFVKSDGPFKTIQELFKHAQANPGKLRVASTGFGSVDDVTVRYPREEGLQDDRRCRTRSPASATRRRWAGTPRCCTSRRATCSSTSRPASSSRSSSSPSSATPPSPTCPARRSWGSRSTCRSSAASWRGRASRPSP